VTSPVYRQRDLVAHQVDESGDLILQDPRTGELVVLNAVGAAAYELLDGERSSDLIIAELAAAFPDVARTRIAADVDVFLRDLAQRGLVLPGTAP
jgi:Coenzyme PQQ synthesis protein D (PqqD)